MIALLHKIPIDELRGVGPARTRQLKKLGVRNVADLLLLAPRRYEDWTATTPIRSLEAGESACVQGEVVQLQRRRTSRRNLILVTARISDDTGELDVIWFVPNQRGGPALIKRLSEGRQVALLGTPVQETGRLVLKGPELRVDLDEGPRLNPVYPLTDGLSQATIRNLVKQACLEYGQHIGEFVCADCIHRLDLLSRAQAIRLLHFPGNSEDVERAWRRLAFDELLCLQLVLMRRNRLNQACSQGMAHRPDGELVKGYLANLPFELTAAQVAVIEDIRRDMERHTAMRRLLQGDVGSGKTAVAVYAIAKSIESGCQAAFMVPTEVLAEQHFSSLVVALRPLGISVGLLTGRASEKERTEVLEGLAAGSVQVVVGTHALIQGGVQFKRLGLTVIDEQHRFGVQQREVLTRPEVDLLVMTATPIPRTLALTLYGDMDISMMDQVPAGRKPIDTRWIAEEDRPGVYRFLAKQVKMGRQGYVVCPLIQNSEEVDAKAAVEHFENLRVVLPDLRFGLLHGQMPYEEKARVMENFYNGQVDILVTTTVIEVGVDVPNATVMVIESAERFGLSQLHQLRGRVGRGLHQSYCLLMGTPTTEVGRERLNVMRRESNGFVIAEADLKLRGPGELLGLRQSGFPELKFASLTDIELLEQVRRVAMELLSQAKEPDFSLPSAIEVELSARFSNEER